DIFGTADAFQFNYQMLTGDGTITARVVNETQTHIAAKAGVMIRESLAAGSKHAALYVTAAEGVSFQRRLATSGVTTSTQGPLRVAPYWVRLVRAGNTLTASSSADGKTWAEVGQDTVSMASAVYVGLAVSSHVAGTLSTVNFDNVTLSMSSGCNPTTFG